MPKWLGYIMALITNNNVKVNPPKPVPIEFSLGEVDALIRALSTSHFATKDIEVLYGGIYKLQELRKRLDNDSKG